MQQQLIYTRKDPNIGIFRFTYGKWYPTHKHADNNRYFVMSDNNFTFTIQSDYIKVSYFTTPQNWRETQLKKLIQ